VNIRTAIALWALALPVAASPAADADIDAIRAEVAALRQDYETRLAALEARLAAAQLQPPAAPAATGFNPAISLIFDGTYRSFERDPQDYAIVGTLPAEGETGPGARNFDIGESELTLSANIDPYFSAFFVASFASNGEVGVEEANLTHIGFLPGATLKFGRFLSAFGYQNEIHAHAWDFVDAPLVHQAFFGGVLSEDGVQVRWVAPTITFWELGAEAGSGAAFPGTPLNRNTPNSLMLFTHVGADIGTNASFRAGASWRTTQARDRDYADVNALGSEVRNRFSGDVDMWGLDFVWKWTPSSATGKQLKLQAEYFGARSDGTFAYDVDGTALPGDIDAQQSGWYAQAVYQFMPRWRTGLRYDALDTGSVRITQIRDRSLDAADLPLLTSNDPTRLTAMLDYSPSEFSRIRLQIADDQARRNTDDLQFAIQYLMSMGSHGAHKY
jgi:hypothetical protein